MIRKYNCTNCVHVARSPCPQDTDIYTQKLDFCPHFAYSRDCGRSEELYYIEPND